MSIKKAVEEELVSAFLYGPVDETKGILLEIGLEVSDVRIIGVSDPAAACAEAVRAVQAGDADILMKGHVPTATLLKAVLNKEAGLLTGSLLNHVGIFQSPNYHKLFVVTDAAMNIAPTIGEKIGIVENAVSLFRTLGVDLPKVAVLGAVETVNLKMPATVDAALLSRMQDCGQLMNCIVEGPLAMDNAISMEAAVDKGIQGAVAGDADILMVPNIECGNMVYKTLNFLGNAKSAGLVVGAKVPIVLTSRADSEMSKYYSIMLAAAISGGIQ